MVAVVGAAAFFSSPSLAIAQEVPNLLRTLAGEDPAQISTPLRLIALMTVLSLVPSVVLLTTCFPRVLIVLSFLRRAIGTQELPPNQIIVGLALFITAAIMAPIWRGIYNDAISPYMEGQITEEVAYDRAVTPLKEFMLEKTLRKDLRLFVELSRYEETVDDTGTPTTERRLGSLPLNVVIPAFMISELKVAFQMGFVIYLPFLIIDLIVATTLISMGMLVLPPFMISLPLKVLVFILVDGWNLVVAQLVSSLV